MYTWFPQDLPNDRVEHIYAQCNGWALLATKDCLVSIIDVIFYFKEKTHLSYANSEDPDQTPRLAASDLGLHCLPVSYL